MMQKQFLTQHYYFKTLTVGRTIELPMKSLKRSTKSVNNQNKAIHSKYVFRKKNAYIWSISTHLDNKIRALA